MIRFHLQSLCAAAVALSAALSYAGEPPLHQQIDQAVGVGTDSWKSLASQEISDAGFARRVHLDLNGVIPTADQLRAFLDDPAENKREKLVDSLLDSPRYARHMQQVFDVMLMERQPDKHVKSDLWREYLRSSFAENKSWDTLAREILAADGADAKLRPAAKFLLDRELKLDVVTRDLGRVFLGRDLQCAQCHDHPHVGDYLQRHYHGLAAFLNRAYLFKDPKTKQASIGEKADGAVKFTSVFTNDTAETPPRMLDLPPLPDPPKPKEPYKVKPDKKNRSVPVYSRRLQLAKAVTDPANEAFCQNIANRLWAMMMGRGIVEPVDMWHEDNPPSNPELLAVLVRAMQSHDYDMRYLIREIALSQSYQRSSEFKAGLTIEQQDESKLRFATATMKPLSPEQLAWSMMQATGLAAQTMEQLQAKQLEKEKKAGTKDSKASDAAWQEEALYTALKRHADVFVSFFGRIGAQSSEFDASANQALFLRNGSLVQSWLAPAQGRLTKELAQQAPAEAAESFYLHVFSRRPSAEEAQSVTDYLKQHEDEREIALRQLVWAGVSSAEFRLNH